MASTENVSPLETTDSSPAAAARDNTTTTTTAAPENPDVPAPSSSAAAETPAQSTQLEAGNTESESKEKSDTEDNEGKSSPSEAAAAAAATATPEENTTTANTTTTNVASEPPSSDVETSETPEPANVPEGQASDQAVKEAEDAGPELVITLLLITGARHPFKIDRKYLRRRSVRVDNDDPFNMSVYTLKELIWKEWRAEWEPQPSSPSSIRLISFGKLLDDKSPLSESSLTHDAPNVIHMTVKPQEVVDEEDAKGGKSYSTRGGDATDRSPGCRCIIL